MCKGTLIVELCNCRVRHAASYFNWYDGYRQHVSSVVIARTHFKLYMDWTYHTHTYYSGLKGEKQKYPNSRE